MPRDAVSRTANVERNGGQKWVNKRLKFIQEIAGYNIRNKRLEFVHWITGYRVFRRTFLRSI